MVRFSDYVYVIMWRRRVFGLFEICVTLYILDYDYLNVYRSMFEWVSIWNLKEFYRLIVVYSRKLFRLVY